MRRPSPHEVLRRVPQRVAADMQVSDHRPSGEVPGREAPTNVGPCKSERPLLLPPLEGSGWGWNRNTMVCRQQTGTWEHVLPLFVPGYTVLFPTCFDNVLNVPLCGYICTRILYPVTNSVPTYLRLERPRRQGRSKRPGTLFVTGYNMRVHTANCSPTFPTFDAPNESQRFLFVPMWVYAGTGEPYVPGSQRNMVQGRLLLSHMIWGCIP